MCFPKDLRVRMENQDRLGHLDLRVQQEVRGLQDQLARQAVRDPQVYRVFRELRPPRDLRDLQVTLDRLVQRDPRVQMLHPLAHVGHKAHREPRRLRVPKDRQDLLGLRGRMDLPGFRLRLRVLRGRLEIRVRMEVLGIRDLVGLEEKVAMVELEVPEGRVQTSMPVQEVVVAREGLEETAPSVEAVVVEVRVVLGAIPTLASVAMEEMEVTGEMVDTRSDRVVEVGQPDPVDLVVQLDPVSVPVQVARPDLPVLRASQANHG